MHRFLALSLSSLLVVPARGSTHAAPAPQEEHAHDPASVTVFGERLLLGLEHPHLVRDAPARSGSVTLEIGSTPIDAAAPRRDGLFVPEGGLPESGSFPARLHVRSDQAEERIDLGSITVHASGADANRAAHSERGEEPLNAVPLLMEPQWKVKLLLAEAESRTLSQRLIVPARAVAPESMSAVVSSSMGGRLVAPPAGALPRTGEHVDAGQMLALVEPPRGAPEFAQLHALELDFDLKALEVLRATGEAEARLRFAERERERIGKLRAEGPSTQQQLEQAEQDLAVARTELEAAGRMKESLERLVTSRGRAAGESPDKPGRLPLEAPIAGTVVEVLGVPGAPIEPGASFFRILDTSRVWPERRVSEFDVLSSAKLRSPSTPRPSSWTRASRPLW